MKYLLLTLSLVFALVIGITGAFKLAVAYLGGQELADDLWKPFSLPTIYIGMLVGIIVVLVIAVKVAKNKNRGRQQMGGK